MNACLLRLVPEVLHTLFVAGCVFVVTGDPYLALALAAGAAGCAHLAQNSSDSLRARLLSFALFDYLFFCHAALRTRSFTSVEADALVWVRFFCGCALLGLAGLTIASNPRALRLSSSSIALLCFCALILAGGSFSVLPRYSVAAGVLFFSVTLGVFSIVSMRGVESAFRVIGCAMLALLVASLAQALFHPADAWLGRRFQGIFLHPLDFGAALSVLAVYFFYDASLPPASLLRRLVNAAVVATCFGLMALAQTRISILATLVAIWYLTLCWHSRIALLIAGGTALLGTALVTAIGPRTALELATRSGHLRELWTLNGRTGIWEYTFSFVRERPIWGYGFGATRRLFANAPAAFGWNVHHAHNLAVQGIIEVGFIGLAALCLVLCLLAVETARLRRPVIGAIVIEIVLRSMTEPVFFFFIPGVMTALLALATVAMPSRRVVEDSAGEGIDVPGSSAKAVSTAASSIRSWFG